MRVRELIAALQRAPNLDAPVHVATPRATEMADCEVTGIHVDPFGVVWIKWPTSKVGSGERHINIAMRMRRWPPPALEAEMS